MAIVKEIGNSERVDDCARCHYPGDHFNLRRGSGYKVLFQDLSQEGTICFSQGQTQAIL